MTMLVTSNPILGKMQKHLEEYGLLSSIVEEKLDFEQDYWDANLLGTTDCIGSVGSLKLFDSPIDYINIVKKQKFVKCDVAMGGSVGMGVHLHSWWKIRFFISFPDYIKLGPFDIGTITSIKKGCLRSTVENFVCSGYQKLTTLPPGLIRDNVADVLYSDQLLKKLSINPQTILLAKNGEIVTEDTKLENKDTIKILSVISVG